MGRALVLAMVLAGCDFAFGLDHVEREVTGHWRRQYEYNDAAGAPRLDVRPLTRDDISLEVRDDNGERLSIDYDYATGAFRFITTTARYHVIAKYSDDNPNEYVHTAQQLEVLETRFGRPDAVKASAGTKLTGHIEMPGANTHIISTGAWGDEYVADAGDYSIDWTGKLLLSSSNNDRLYVARYEQRDDAVAITQIATGPIEMIDGTATTFSASLMDFPPAYCARLHVERAEELARVKAAHPDLTSTDLTGWGLFATPLPGTGPRIALTLANDATGTCQDCMARYSTPFTGFKTLLQMGVQISRPVPPYAVNNYAGASLFHTLADSINCESYTARAAQTGIATNVRWNGTLLVGNGMEVSVGDRVEVTWDIGGPFDTFIVDLYDATGSAPHGTRLRRVFAQEPRVVFDAELFTPGGAYNILISHRIGLPSAADGDFTKVGYPFGDGYMSGPVVVVRR